MEYDWHNERPGEFTFTWSIQNYSYCMITEDDVDGLSSPDFVVDFLGEDVWWLRIYPRGDEAPGFFTFYLRRRNGEATCNFTLEIRMSNGQFKESDEYIFSDCSSHGCLEFISLEELKGSDRYIVNDTLTLRCRMWKNDDNISASVKWEAHSRIKVSKLHYTWILNDILISNTAFEADFNKSIDITEFFTEKTQISSQVLFKRSLCECAIQFCIKMIKPKKNYFWIAVVHLIDASGRVAHSSRSEHLFESSDETLDWSFPLISKEKLYHYKILFLPKNQLTLKCELSFVADNELETFEYRTTKELELEPSTIKLQSDLDGVWIKNMQQCYMDGKFTDFVIRTPGRQFPVNRTILSAHSEVFNAMMERDMKERKTGMVDIEDLDDDTVSMMLTYIYTSTLNDIDCPSAQKLYFAADKYGIRALQKKLSIYLMCCLDVSNVCDILELADRHEDQELKSCARDFFHAHAKEIMSSEIWKQLKETNLTLTSKTMEWMICNKFLM